MIPLNFEFLKYAIHDEHGVMIGIRDDAPEEIKKYYYEMEKRRKEQHLR